MSRTAALVMALLVVSGALGSSSLAQVAPLPVPKITWRVDNSFRFFSDAADTEVHRATFLALPPEDQLQHPILAAEQALSARHEDGWAETMFRDTCWDARNNRFACKDGPLEGNPFLTIVAGAEQLPELGRLVLWKGAQDIAFD